MNIFNKKPLSTVLLTALGFFVLSALCSTVVKWIIVSVCLLLLAFFAIFRKKFSPKWIFLAAVVLVSSLFSHLYFDLYFYAFKRFEGEVGVTATITQINYAETYGGYFSVSASDVNGKAFSHYKFTVRMDNDCSALNVGDKLTFSATISDFDASNKNYYFSSGYSGELTASEYTFLEKDTKNIQVRIAQVRSRISAYVYSISEGKAGGLLQSLLVGDKSNLSPQLSLDFQNAGISHLLALSGLHLVILSAFISAILSLFGIGKRGTMIALLIFVPIYIVLTGASASILRAGIMLMLSSLFFLCGLSKDSITNLCISMTLIVLISPFSIFSLSFWLSSVSTFGILAFSTIWERKPGKQIGRKLLAPLFLSLSAQIATLPISFFFFGTFSPISVFSTVAVGFLVEIYMYVGYVALLLKLFFNVSIIFEFLYFCIEKLSANLANFSFSFIYIDGIFSTVAIILLCVVTAAFLLIPMKRKKAVLCTVLACFFILLTVNGVLDYRAEKFSFLSYFPDGNSEYFVGTSNGESYLFDFTKDDYHSVKNATEAVRDCRIKALDHLVISQYSKNTPSGVLQLLSTVQVRKVYLPVPKSQAEYDLIVQLANVISQFRTDVVFYFENDSFAIGDFIWRSLVISEYTKGSGSVFTFQTPDGWVSYFGRGMYDKVKAELASDLCANSYVVIFGCHGYQSDNSRGVNFSSETLRLLISSEDKKIERAGIEDVKIFYTPLSSRYDLYVE